METDEVKSAKEEDGGKSEGTQQDREPTKLPGAGDVVVAKRAGRPWWPGVMLGSLGGSEECAVAWIEPEDPSWTWDAVETNKVRPWDSAHRELSLSMGRHHSRLKRRRFTATELGNDIVAEPSRIPESISRLLEMDVVDLPPPRSEEEACAPPVDQPLEEGRSPSPRRKAARSRPAPPESDQTPTESPAAGAPQQTEDSVASRTRSARLNTVEARAAAQRFRNRYLSSNSSDASDAESIDRCSRFVAPARARTFQRPTDRSDATNVALVRARLEPAPVADLVAVAFPNGLGAVRSPASSPLPTGTVGSQEAPPWAVQWRREAQRAWKSIVSGRSPAPAWFRP